MVNVVHDLLIEAARSTPRREALKYQAHQLTYEELTAQMLRFAAGLLQLGLARLDRVAVYMEKRVETVVALFGASAAGGVFVPINPLLKPEQVSHILQDCDVRVLVTTTERFNLLEPSLRECKDLRALIVVGTLTGLDSSRFTLARHEDLVAAEQVFRPHRAIDAAGVLIDQRVHAHHVGQRRAGDRRGKDVGLRDQE